MGKKKSSSGYTSKGERRNVNKKLCKAMRREKPYVEKVADAWHSWMNGAQTPKMIQRDLNIGPKIQYKQWIQFSRPQKRV